MSLFSQIRATLRRILSASSASTRATSASARANLRRTLSASSATARASSASARANLKGLKEEIAQLRANRARKKREKRWRRTKDRVREARTYCENQLLEQFWDEYLQRVMTARICDAKLPGFGESRIHWLHRAGIKTAYDVHQKGVTGIHEVYSIGPTLVKSLVEWAEGHVPESLPLDTDSREYFQRLRALKRKHLDVKGYQ